MLELLLAILASALGIGVVAALGYHRNWQWTGLPADPGDGSPSHPARPARTAWDWLQLLIVPFVLALAAFGLNLAQSDRDRRAADDRAREDTLRTYIQQMSDLITDHGLRTKPRVQRLDDPPTSAQVLARTLTLAALRQLDPVRRGLVVQFLAESDLIMVSPKPTRNPEVPKVILARADLRGVVMPRLRGRVDLPDERPADLPEEPPPRLSGRRVAVFELADLRDADFHGLFLDGAIFNSADLRGANFTDAFINGADFSLACLSGARFINARAGTKSAVVPSRPARFYGTEGQGVDFTGADLTDVDLSSSQLTQVKIVGADGRRANIPPAITQTGKAGQPCKSFFAAP